MAHFQDVKIFACKILHSHLVLNEHQFPCSFQGRAKWSQKIQRESAASNARPLTTLKWNYWSTMSFCSPHPQGQTFPALPAKASMCPNTWSGDNRNNSTHAHAPRWKEQMFISQNQGCNKYLLISEAEWVNIYSAFCFSFSLDSRTGCARFVTWMTPTSF